MVNRKVVPGHLKKPNLHRRKRKQRKIKMRHFQPHFSCKHKVSKEKEEKQKKKQAALTCIKIQERGLIICHKKLLLLASISWMLLKMSFMDGNGSVQMLVSNASIDTCCLKVIKLFPRSKELKKKLNRKQINTKNRKHQRSKLRKKEQPFHQKDLHLLLKNHLRLGNKEEKRKNKKTLKKNLSSNR